MWKANHRILPGKREKYKQIEVVKYDLSKYKFAYFFYYGSFKHWLVKKIMNQLNWEDSKVFLPNKFLKAAFTSLKEKNLPDISEVLRVMDGRVGTLLTNREEEEVVDWFENFSLWDYPNVGYEVDVTIKLYEGYLPQFDPVIEPYLRQLGIPTTLHNGAVFLTKDFVVCEAGNILNSEQIYLLEMLGEKIAVHKFWLKGKWSRERGYVGYISDDEIERYSDFEENSDFEGEL